MNRNERNNVLQKTFFSSSRNYYRSQFIQQLDRWSYRIISLGFLFLTIGILSGAVWANEAWGSYWNWDPKETWAFITWTIFAIYLHIGMKGTMFYKKLFFLLLEIITGLSLFNNSIVGVIVLLVWVFSF
ncbi:Cytochrome c biogenesis protein CcsA [Arachis hypogaea]|nr:Cytochrome c biogenesis protein CcsA [Arachis hypogaea]